MPVIRLALLLAILGGLTLFALQNSSPAVPLVILGVQTQAFPLAVWMVGAIAAGAFTTLVIAALFGISNTFSAPRTRRPAAPRETSRSTSADESWDKGWTESQNSSYSTAAAAATASSANTTTGYTQSASPNPKSSFDFRNDWENVGAPVEEWEDWQDYEEPVDAPRAQASPEASSSYSSSSYNSQTYIQEPEEREEWEDWEEELDTPPQTPAQPQRTDYEVRRDPKTSYQSGSVYSYSYREPSDSGVGKTESVYDADYRVIIPPARSLDDLDGEPVSNQVSDDEDWDFEDDFEDEGDRPRH